MTVRRRRWSAALEVDHRAVALEVARPGEDEVGPADGEALEQRDRDHGLGVLGERADRRVGGGLVAGDDQEADRVRVGLVGVVGRGPRLADAARRSGSAAGRRRPSPRGRGAPSAAASAATRMPPSPCGPDQISTARSAARSSSASVRVELRPGDLEDARAVAAGGAEPEVDDRRPLDDRRRRRPRRRSARRGSPRAAAGTGRARSRPPRGGRRCARRARRGRAARARRPARPSRCRSSAVTMRVAGRAQQPLGLVERLVPRDRLEPGAARGAAARGSGRRRAGAGTRSAPCRRASPRRPPGGCARGCASPCPRASSRSMLQPTGQRPQTVGTFWISHGRASKRYCVEVSAPTGQSSITLPEKGAR